MSPDLRQVDQSSGSDDACQPTRGSALAALAQRYAPALSRYFQRRVAHQSDVPDLVQDVFLRLARLRDLSAIEKPEHYLFTTAASALRDRARRDSVRQRTSHEAFDELDHWGPDVSPERILAGRRAIERLQQAVRELPERTRDVFVLRVFEEFKMADVAHALGISQRSAEKHYAKGLAYVTAVLEEHRHA